MRSHRFLPVFGLVLCLSGGGCAAPGSPWAAAPIPAENPVFVSGGNHEAVWERTVDALHDYFDIAREDKQNGIIETQYKVGSGILEPWHRDSVGPENRLVASLQSIRRRAFVSITPIEGGYLIGVEAFEELEDLPGVAANSAGGATFHDFNPLQRNLDLVVGQSTPSGWVPQGRDPALEQAILARVQAEFSG